MSLAHPRVEGSLGLAMGEATCSGPSEARDRQESLMEAKSRTPDGSRTSAEASCVPTGCCSHTGETGG